MAATGKTQHRKRCHPSFSPSCSLMLTPFPQDARCGVSPPGEITSTPCVPSLPEEVVTFHCLLEKVAAVFSLILSASCWLWVLLCGPLSPLQPGLSVQKTSISHLHVKGKGRFKATRKNLTRFIPFRFQVRLEDIMGLLLLTPEIFGIEMRLL